jgi:DNA-binding MarR family transcriptional regulator
MTRPGDGEPAPPQHPRHELDELIHSPVRLSIMATLATAGETDFRYLREALQISDSLLSKHAAQLEASGYLHVVKGFVGKRPSTWFSLTDQGRAAFDRYRGTLARILGDSAGTAQQTPPPDPTGTPGTTATSTSTSTVRKGTDHDA